MAATAQRIGADAAPMLVDALLRLENTGSDLVDVMQEFLAIYGRMHSVPLADAVLSRVTPNGPPALVEALEHTGRNDTVSRLRPLLDRTHANDELLTSLASVLGALGGDAARALLLELRARPNASAALLREVSIALDALDRK